MTYPQYVTKNIVMAKAIVSDAGLAAPYSLHLPGLDFIFSS